MALSQKKWELVKFCSRCSHSVYHIPVSANLKKLVYYNIQCITVILLCAMRIRLENIYKTVLKTFIINIKDIITIILFFSPSLSMSFPEVCRRFSPWGSGVKDGVITMPKLICLTYLLGINI